jgi:hypothetical protein
MDSLMLKRIIVLLFMIPVFSGNYTYAQNIQPEKVIAITDRDVYIAGENILLRTRIFSEKLSRPTPSNVCYVLLRDITRSYCKIFIKTEADNTGTTSIFIPDTLKTGYYELVAFTNYMRNFGEEHYYRKQIIIVNRFDEWLTSLSHQSDSISAQMTEQTWLSIRLEKDSFKLREKVKVKVTVDSGMSKFKDFSISIKPQNQFLKYSNIIYNEVNSLTEYPDKGNFPAERDGFYITGKIISSDSLPFPNECLFLSTADSIVNLQYTHSDILGNFQFLLNDYHLGKQLIIKPQNNWNSKSSILTDDKYNLKKPFKAIYFGITPELRKYIQVSQNIVRIQKAYGIVNFNLTQQSTKSKIPYVFRGNYVIVRPADFVNLKNFKEISENILPGTRVKNERNDNFLYLLSKDANYYFQNPAAIFLDGVYVYDLKTIMNYSSTSISKIELLPAKRIIGDLSFDGIVSVSSVNKPKTFDFDAGSCILNMPSLSGMVTYISPNYSYRSLKDPIPDLRQLLYWNALPNITDFEFYTSDLPGDYLVEIDGTDEDGNIKKAFSTFKVLSK